MKKILFLLLSLTVVASSAFCKEKKNAGNEVVRIAIEGGWKPYNFVDEKGEITGFDVDVVNAIAERIGGLTIKFEPTPWDGMLVALSAGRFDAVANEIKKNPAREKQYLYASYGDAAGNTAAKLEQRI